MTEFDDAIARGEAMARRLDEELRAPEPGIWWLSFADEDDGHWLGGCYIEAEGPGLALWYSRQLGINPGGEVAIVGPVSREAFNAHASTGAQLGRLLQMEDLDDLVPLPEEDSP